MIETVNNSHGGYEKRDIKPRNLILVTIISLILLVVIIVWLNEYFVSIRSEVEDQQLSAAEPVEYLKLRAAQDSLLTTQELVDSTQGIYRIPIDHAMQLVVDESNSKGH